LFFSVLERILPRRCRWTSFYPPTLLWSPRVRLILTRSSSVPLEVLRRISALLGLAFLPPLAHPAFFYPPWLFPPFRYLLVLVSAGIWARGCCSHPSICLFAPEFFFLIPFVAPPPLYALSRGTLGSSFTRLSHFVVLALPFFSPRSFRGPVFPFFILVCCTVVPPLFDLEFYAKWLCPP